MCYMVFEQLMKGQSVTGKDGVFATRCAECSQVYSANLLLHCCYKY
jgi:hypothetical protein